MVRPDANRKETKMGIETKQPENQTPIKTFRDRAISLSIWENQHTNPETGESSTYYSLELQRGYKRNNAWHHTTSIISDDALRVASLYQEAHRWLLTRKYALSPTHADGSEMEPSLA
jgi:hypothetical protein